MSLSFPDILHVQVVDEAGQPITGKFAVSLRLHAHVKNDYSLLKVTVLGGKVEFTLDEIQDEISRSQRLFIMDYAATMADCDELVTIRILSSEEVQRAVRAHEMFQLATGIPDEYIRALRETENSNLEPAERKLQLSSKLSQVSVNVVITTRKQNSGGMPGR